MVPTRACRRSPLDAGQLRTVRNKAADHAETATKWKLLLPPPCAGREESDITSRELQTVPMPEGLIQTPRSWDLLAYVLSKMSGIRPFIR